MPREGFWVDIQVSKTFSPENELAAATEVNRGDTECIASNVRDHIPHHLVIDYNQPTNRQSAFKPTMDHIFNSADVSTISTDSGTFGNLR